MTRNVEPFEAQPVARAETRRKAERCSLEAEPHPSARPLHHLLVAVDRDRRFALGPEQVRRGAGFSLQAAQGSQLAPSQGMRRRRAALRSADVQDAVIEIDLIPAPSDRMLISWSPQSAAARRSCSAPVLRRRRVREPAIEAAREASASGGA
jgi:hypothetical protein